jgi:serine/threonine protein kinase
LPPHALPRAFGGRFTTRARIGEGGVGVVYEAYDQERRTVVALKVLKAPSAETILLLKNEFRSVQDLRHPNLVQLGELFQEGREWFFTMEFVRGSDFLQYVRDAPPDVDDMPNSGEVVVVPGRFDEARLRGALVQLASGLDALHAAGKVHRDVKPSNVLVTREGRVVVLDFGILRDLRERAREEDTLAGTGAYMAPEQGMLDAVTPAMDWYAVGTVLFQALTGCLPFEGSFHELLSRKNEETAPRASDLVPGLPKDLDDLCAELLRVDPEARPTGAEILRRLGASPEAHHSGRHAIFVGRRQELRELEAAFEDVAATRAPVSILVDGESGVGKSHLVQHFIRRLSVHQPSTVVSFGRCYERESVPYKAVDGVIDGLAAYLSELSDAEAADLVPPETTWLAQAFPVLAPALQRQTPTAVETVVNPREQRERVFAALRDLLRRLTARVPLVLVIDDIQWADADSLALLGEVLRPPEAPPLLLVCATRSATETGRSASAESTPLPGDVRRLRLEKLPTRDSEELVSQLLGPRAPEDEIRAIASESGGHPLFIDELVRHGNAPASGNVRARLDEALWMRVERVGAEARRLLEVIAVAGVPMVQELVAGAAMIDTGQVFELSAQLRGEHLVRTSGPSREDTIEPYHDRVRESVLAHLDEGTRTQWHGRLAVALESANGDPELLETHWLGAGQPHRAARYAALAGDRAAATLAFERAARAYRHALDLGVAEGIDARSIQQRLAEALTNAGRGAEAAEVRLALAARAPELEALDLRRQAAEQLLCTGHFERGVELLHDTLSAFRVTFPRSPLVTLLFLAFFRLLVRLRGLAFRERDPKELAPRALVRIDALRSAGSGFSMSDNARGAYFQARNLLVALAAGDPPRIMHALAMEVCFVASTGTRDPRNDRLLESTRALAERLGTPPALAEAATASGYSHFFRGEWAAAKEWLARGEVLFRDQCVGYTFELASTRAILYRALSYTGELRELAARAEPVIRDVEARGDRYSSINLRATVRTLLGLAADEPERVAREVDEASAWLAPKRFLIQHFFCFTAQTQLDLYRGEAKSAYERAVRIWPLLRRSLLLRVRSIRISGFGLHARATLAATAAGVAAKERLLAEAERDARAMERTGQTWGVAEATVVRAGIARLRGDAAGAKAAYERAIALYDEAGMALYAAGARRRLGTLVGGADGDRLLRIADARLHAEGVKDPVRFTNVLAP